MLGAATHPRVTTTSLPALSALNRLGLRLFAPVDIAALVYFRIVLAAILLWEIGRYVANGWIERYWITPTFHFTYYGLGWVQPWPGNGIGVVYFFGGVAKLNGDWLRGEPLRSWLAQQTDFPLLGSYFTQEWLVYLFAYGGLGLDLFIVGFLLWRKTRLFACLFVLFFHLSNAQLFSIGIFPWFMLAATLLFFPPDWPRRVIRKLTPQHISNQALAKESVNKPAALPRRLSRGQKLTIALLTLYVLFQVSLPLRHLLYPGNVHWTEEGHNFSWHMKLRDKLGQTHFMVRDPVSGERRLIENQDYLSSRQISKMSTRPDMILQFAHYLAQVYRAQGYPRAEVYAHAMISLNGRKPQLMIDPLVNLAAQPRNLWPAPWILPLQEALPQRHIPLGNEGE